MLGIHRQLFAYYSYYSIITLNSNCHTFMITYNINYNNTYILYMESIIYRLKNMINKFNLNIQDYNY